MINDTLILDYADKEAAGLALVKATKDSIVLTVKRFSPEDGHELPAQDINVSPESIDVTIAVLEKRLANLKTLKEMVR